MAGNRQDTPKPAEERSQPAGNGQAAAAPAPPPPPPAAAGGGFAAWVPLLATVIVMPLLAYGTTTFVLLPKLRQTVADPASGTTAKPPAAPAEKQGASEAKEGGTGKTKVTAPLEKVLVNISGSMGTRYLLVKLTLVGTQSDFKRVVEKNEDQLRDLASSALSSKTISDLEKPGARNLIRSELLSVFNNALGGSVVQEIYFTEFAVQ